jgi:hypothetical protein
VQRGHDWEGEALRSGSQAQTGAQKASPIGLMVALLLSSFAVF